MLWRKACSSIAWLLWWMVAGLAAHQLWAQTFDDAAPPMVRSPFLSHIEIAPPIIEGEPTLELRPFYALEPWIACPELGLDDVEHPGRLRAFSSSGDGPIAVDGCRADPDGESLCRPPCLVDCVALFSKDMLAFDGSALKGPPRLLLFRMPSGFLANPIGLGHRADAPGSAGGDDDYSFLQFGMGSHIPYLDMYRRGDPGGAGYTRFYSQVQLLDSGASSVCLGLQAFKPASQASEGLINGPTTLMPNLSAFQEIHDGTALHAFIGQNVLANARWREQLSGSFQYGLALQQPVLPANTSQGLFLFVQALGECHLEGYRADPNSPPAWQLIPGVQWRVSDACWMNLGISRYNFLSCSWQY